jgi:CheY-like chemotaxis protein
VITDINLPGLSGMAIARNIRNHADPEKAGVPVLALTGDVPEHDIDQYSEAGINDHIIKPFDEKGLISKLEKYL